MEIKNKKKFKILIFSITLGLQLLVLCTLLLNYLSFTNTLSKKNNWHTTKNQLFQPASDGMVFADQTQSLASNSLNLSAWRAWNEVYLQKKFSWKSLSLEFLPNENSYLYVIFHKTQENFSAIRISYSPLFDNAVITAKYTGEFIEFTPIYIPNLDNLGWQKLFFKKNHEQSSTIEFWYNNQLITTHTFSEPLTGNIAFRAGKEPMLIDNIRIKNNQDQIVFKENFDQLDKFWFSFICLVTLVFILDFIFYWLIKIQEKKIKPFIQLNFALCLMFLLINVIFLFFSHYIRSRYPDADSLLRRIKFKNDNQEQSKINNTESDELLNQYSTEFDQQNTTRIMFIGSSQTKGEGSSLKGEDFVSQFASLVKKHNEDDGQKFEIINASVAGFPACELFTYFETKWIKLKPNFVVINLSSNDEQYGLQFAFEETLENFIRMSKAHSFTLVFVAEANSIEINSEMATHQIMEKIAKEHHIVFIDMHHYLTKYTKNGILWWDFVHPTSFGHQLIANHLFQSLKPLILD
jgi:lysophospholipase L1-like esterase